MVHSIYVRKKGDMIEICKDIVLVCPNCGHMKTLTKVIKTMTLEEYNKSLERVERRLRELLNDWNEQSR